MANGKTPHTTSCRIACESGDVDTLNDILNKMSPEEMEVIADDVTLLHSCAKGGSVECFEAVIEVMKPTLDDLNRANKKGLSPLHVAALKNYSDVTEYLIKIGADKNVTDEQGHTPLFLAAASGNYRVAEVLMNLGADVCLVDKTGISVYHCSAQNCLDERSDTARLLKLLLSSSDKLSVDCKDDGGRSPLIWASSIGSKEGVSILIDNKADCLLPDKGGITALHCAASRGYTDIAELLISTQAKTVDATDKFGCTPLFYSAAYGQVETTKLLLKFGANPNHQDVKGRSSIHCAVSKENEDLMSILEENGANLWLEDKKSLMPIHEAAIHNTSGNFIWLFEKSDGQMDINRPIDRGMNVLHIAANHSNDTLVKYLLDKGADANCICDTQGRKRTALDICLSNDKTTGHTGQSECRSILIEYGGKLAEEIEITETEAATSQPRSLTLSESHSEYDSSQITLTSPSENLTGKSNSSSQATSQESPPGSVNRVIRPLPPRDTAKYRIDVACRPESNYTSAVKPAEKRLISVYDGRRKDSMSKSPTGQQNKVNGYPEISRSGRPATTGTVMKKESIASVRLPDPYKYTSIPFTRSHTTSFVNVNSLFKDAEAPRKSPTYLNRPSPRPMSVKERIQSSAANYDAIRNSARKLNELYRRSLRPLTSLAPKKNDGRPRIYHTEENRLSLSQFSSRELNNSRQSVDH